VTATTEIAIVGAGIAGLATAVALRQAGIDAVVYEQTRALGEVGAGVSLTANSIRVIGGLGLLPRLDEQAVRLTDGMVLYAQSGERLGGPSAGAGDGRNVHRADLIDVFRSALPPGAVRLASRLESVSDLGDHVELRFADGSSVRAAGVVGADGIHSVVRSAVGAAPSPVFSGMVAYRGLIPAERMPEWPLTEATMYVGAGRHFLVFPVRRGTLLNFVAFVPADEHMQESWSAPGDPVQLADEFRDWAEPVRRFIAQIDTTFQWGLYDREPLERWTRGRVTLAGDAAHAMLPHAGQGANQSIEDAAALAALLDGRPAADIPAAFVDYETARRERAAFVQLFARRLGLEYDSGGSELAPQSGQPLAGKAEVSMWIKNHDATRAALKVRDGGRVELPMGAPV
jgi:salicylate hydroxylase